MQQSGRMMGGQFAKPGPVLRAVLWTVGILGVLFAIWCRASPSGEATFGLLTFVPEAVLHGQVWRLFTAGFLSPPGGNGSVSHLVFTLIGLYFLSTDLERRWGGRTFAFFLAACTVGGFALTLLVSFLPYSFGRGVFHPAEVYGAGAAITGTAVAWSQLNADLEVRLFFVLPIKGRYLLWMTIGWCVLALVFADPPIEGVVAPFGGVLAGLLLAGSPSPVRAMYLQWKLKSLRRQSGGLSAAAMLEPTAARRTAASSSLRVVKGGLDDDGPKREPPRDKRYLN